MPKARTFSAEFKAQLVLEVLTGNRTSAEVCRQHQIHPNLFARWRSTFMEQAPSIFNQEQTHSAEQERIAELERMLGRLTMELEVTKKASNLLGSVLSRNEK
ncbi:MAG: transposase [Phormidesmis sp.]